MIEPSLEGLGLPQDDGFAAFVAEQMKKFQAEEALALEAEEWPSIDVEDSSPTTFQVAQVEGCGHAVHVENPLELLRLLRTFLSQFQSQFTSSS